MEATPPSFKELLRKGQLVSAARIADLDESETIQLARRLAEMIPHWSEVSLLPAVVEGAIAAGVKAGHFKPGDLSTELLTGKLLDHIPPVSVELRMNGKLRMQRSWRARRVAKLLVRAGLVDSVLLREFGERMQDVDEAIATLVRHPMADQEFWRRVSASAAIRNARVQEALLATPARHDFAVRGHLIDVATEQQRLTLLRDLLEDKQPDAALIFRRCLALSPEEALDWIAVDPDLAQRITSTDLLPALNATDTEIRMRALTLLGSLRAAGEAPVREAIRRVRA